MRGIVILLAGCGRIGFASHPETDAHVPQSYRDVVLADRPIGYWRLDDTGAVAHDELGQNDGAYVGTCTHQVTGALADDPDTATAFDGTSCSLSLGSSFAFPGQAAYSLELWLATSNPAASQFVAMQETRSASNDPIDGYAMVISNDVMQGLGVYAERVVGNVNDSTTPKPIGAAFEQLVMTYDGGESRMFVDGTDVADLEDTRAMNVYDAPLYIGGFPGCGALVVGVIDEVSVYDHVLAIDRIALHDAIGTTGPQ